MQKNVHTLTWYPGICFAPNILIFHLLCCTTPIWFVFCWVAKSAFGTTPHFWAAKNWVPQWHFLEKQVLERWFSASHLRFSVNFSPFWISIVANLDLTNGSTVRVHLRFVRRKYQDGVLWRVPSHSNVILQKHWNRNLEWLVGKKKLIKVDFHRGVFSLEQGVKIADKTSASQPITPTFKRFFLRLAVKMLHLWKYHYINMRPPGSLII